MLTGTLATMCMFTSQEITEANELVPFAPDYTALSIDTATKKYGACSLRISGASGDKGAIQNECIQNASSYKNKDVACGWWVRFTSFPSSSYTDFAFLGTDVAGSRIAYLAIDSAGSLRIIPNGAGPTIWTSSTTLSTGTWYWVVFHLYNYGGAGSNGYYRAKIYNTSRTLLEDSGWISSVYLGADIGSVGCGIIVQTVNGLDMNIDSFMAMGGGMDPPIAPDFVEFLPSGAGFYGQWTLGAGADKVAAVNTVPHDDNTSYIKSNTTGTKSESYIHPTSGIPGGSNILALGIRAVVYNANAAGVICATLLRLSTDMIQTYSFAAGEGYNYKCRHFAPTKPNGTEWTVANINNVELGVRTYLATGTDLRVTAIFAFTAYGPDAPAALKLNNIFAKQAVNRALTY